MSNALLNMLESESRSPESFAEELRENMSAVQVRFHWFGTRRSVSVSQKHRAAQTFSAEKDYVSMGKKLFDTSHPAWKHLTRVRGEIEKYWQSVTLPYPDPGIRLMRRSDIAAFEEKMQEMQVKLQNAERNLDVSYHELRAAARNKLGSLYNEGDYPETLIGMFTLEWDFPNVEAPEYLRTISPNLYRRATERIQSRFTEAVTLAEEAFFGELSGMVSHLAERITGSDDGKPKVFRDSVINNLLDFFERFKRLNIGSSEELDRFVAEVQGIVAGVAPDDLRDSGSLRGHVARELGQVRQALDEHMIDRPRRNLIRNRPLTPETVAA